MSKIIASIEAQLPGLVQSAISDAMSGQVTPGNSTICQLHAKDLEELRDGQTRDHKILTGNGDPKSGIVTKLELVIEKVADIEKSVNSIKNAAWVFVSAVLLYVLQSVLVAVFG